MKPHSPLWVRVRIPSALLVALGCLLAAPYPQLFAQCPLTCLGQTNLALGPDGQALFTPHNGLANIQAACIDDYSAMLLDEWNVPVSNPVDCSFLGRNLAFKITYVPTGNHCWGQVLIEDKLPPTLVCEGAEIHCNESSDPLEAGILTATDNCDPDPEILLAFEEIRDLSCQHPDTLIREIERRWFARDTSGNESPLCTQLITIRRATLNDVRFPLDRKGADAIPCDTPDLDPALTGEPLVFGGANDPLCKVLFTYEDDTLVTCPGGYLVNRTWTALDCCTSETITALQTLEVADAVPPALSCPPDLTISTREDTCTADFTLPLAVYSDNCSPGVDLSISTSWGGVGPGPYTGIPEGGYKIHYTATDSCGNSITCTMDFVIKDLVPPVALCRFPVHAYLNEEGLDTIRYEDVNAGSFDNCTMTMGQVKLMGEPDSLFRDSLFVDCSFIGKDTMIILRVEDCWYNSAICMTPLVVIDTLPPFFLCPPDTVLSCTAFADYPDIGGVAFASDNCAGHTLSHMDSLSVNDCGVGTLYRTWMAEDTYGNVVSCNQIIGLADSTLPVIQWPADITLDCAESIDPLYSGEPEIEENCSLLAIGHQDSLIIVDNGCDTLFRIWRVKDWCTDFDTRYIQRIDLIDPVPILEIDCPDDITVYLDNACEIDIDLDPAVAFDECGHYVLITNDSPYADESGSDASGTYPFGEHTTTFTIRDACSLITCQQLLSVRDTVPPFLLCNDVVTCMPEDSMYILTPADVVVQAFDLCSPVTLSVVGDTIFDCDDVMKSIPIMVEVMDSSGNTAHCEQILFLINCDDVCEDLFAGGGITLGGRITAWDESPLGGVPVMIDFGPYQDMVVTGPDGHFIAGPYPQGIEVTVKAQPVPGDLEGISTADLLAIGRHLTGLKPLTWIESLLAADLNRSGSVSVSDMVALRKAILYQIADMQAGYWRLAPVPLLEEGMPAAHNPALWNGAWHLSDMTTSHTQLDFRGVKAGDVDRSTMGSIKSPEESFRFLDLKGAGAPVSAGEPIRLAFTAEGTDKLAGFQMCLAYDTDLVKFEGLQTAGLPSLKKEHVMADLPGRIRLSWDNVLVPETPGHEPLFELVFTANRDLSGSDWIWLNLDGFPAEFYYSGETTSRIHLRSTGEANAGTPATSQLLPFVPNPFSDFAVLPFELDKDGPVTLRVYDVNGTLILEKRDILPAGRHMFRVESHQLPYAGTYMIQMKTVSAVHVRPLTFYTR